tara:strand:- start:2580 stop:2870 length:291 start_codon:yes stop_codon:yes gene_type:complete
MAKKCKRQDGSVGYIRKTRLQDGTFKEICFKDKPQVEHVKIGGVKKSVETAQGSMKLERDASGNKIKCGGTDSKGAQKYKWIVTSASGDKHHVCKT